MAAPLSALPAEGGFNAGGSLITGATQYEFRWSVDEVSWEVVAATLGDSGPYVSVVGLAYDNTYYVQYRSVDGIDTDWSESVTVQPWIDPEEEFATVFRQTNVHGVTSYGDLGATYENDTWAVVLTVDRIRLNGFQSFFCLNAQFSTVDGNCGFLVGATDTNTMRAVVVTGASSSTSIATTQTFARGRHTIAVSKSGTTVTIYDEDGDVIATGTTTSATMDWTTSTSQRTLLNAHWATDESTQETARHTGSVIDIAYVPGGFTAAERTALLRHHRERYYAEDTERFELFLDNEKIESDVSFNTTLLEPTRQGEVLQSQASPSHYSGLSYVDVQYDEDSGDWRMWVAALKYVASSITQYGLGRFDSPDGVSWTEPNLGISGSTGLLRASASSFLAQNALRGDSDAPAGQEFLYLLEIGGATGSQIYGAADEDTAPSLLDTYNAAVASEGKCIVQRDDGRFLVYYTIGQATSDRRIGVIISEDADSNVVDTTHDLAVFSALDGSDTSEQYYSLRVAKIDSNLWLQFVTIYDEPDEHTHVHLYTSRQQGLDSNRVAGHWLEHAESGEWDGAQVYAGSLVRYGDTWRLYYTGHDQPHADVEGSSIGYVTLTYGRFVEVAA